MRAELLRDGGERARSAAFFRCEEFQRAEHVTHSLVVEDRLAAGLSGARDPGRRRPARRQLRLRLSGGGGARRTRAARPARGGLVGRRPRGGVPARQHRRRAACLEGGTLRSEVELVDPRAPARDPLDARAPHPPQRAARVHHRESDDVAAFGALYGRRWCAPRRRSATSSATTTWRRCWPRTARASSSRMRPTAGRRRGRYWSRATACSTTSWAAPPTACSSTPRSRAPWRR